MSRRTQLTTKFIFQITAQLSENFIFIYLGLSLFTENGLEYKPLFILVSVFGICVARYCAVFPLSAIVNWVIRYRARKQDKDNADELPRNHQIMLFWAGLRGAVGVALAAGLQTSQNGFVLRATVLVVVVLTVIIFGGTTARMLEIMEIRTGVVEEIDSDDEFDIEVVHSNGMYRRKSGGIGLHPRPGPGSINLDNVNGNANGNRPRLNSRAGLYSTGNVKGSPPDHPEVSVGRRNSGRNLQRDAQSAAERGLLAHDSNADISDDDTDLDLPPAARRMTPASSSVDDQPLFTPASSGADESSQSEPTRFSARGAINTLLNASSEDAASMFNRIDEGFIKPHLLLDPGGSRSNTPSGS